MKVILAALALFAPFASYAENSPTPVSVQDATSNKGAKVYSRFSVFTSRSGRQTDFRSVRTTGTDDSGSISEKSLFPNLNFLTALAIVTPADRHQVSALVLQSLDPVAKRTLPTPTGKSMVIPGRIAAARYRYDLSPSFSVSASQVHVDTSGFADPSFGLAFLTFDPNNRMYKFGINQTAPLTESSHNSHLITKSTLRASVVARKEEWVTTGYLSHSRPFYGAGANLSGSSPQVTVARPSPLPTLQEVDIVILQKEKNRSTASATIAYTRKALTFSASAMATHFRTFKEKSIWATTVKPLGIAYTSKNKWETGASFNLTSAIEKYRSPSLPSQWNIGVYLSYSMGVQPAI
ncbi:MAG: hypothetical protein ACXWQO_18255 [Bdellovibrionota bacterium]